MAGISLGEGLVPETLLAAVGKAPAVKLGWEARSRMKISRAIVDRLAAGKDAVYGVNTGFGALAHTRIAPDKVHSLQRNLLLSHAVGTGPDLPAVEKRLALLLKMEALAKGSSGVRIGVVEWLMKLYRSGWLPRVPAQGSVGASGDLAPLAHLFLPVIGAGELVSPEGRSTSARRALARIGMKPLELEAKDGLALVNGMEVTNAMGIHAWARLRNLSRVADAAGALSVEGLLASHRPFDVRVFRLRAHPGATRTGANLRKLLAGSGVAQAHADCDRVQDPYSFRCMPQVHGAAKDAVAHLGAILVREADSVTDNPLVLGGRHPVVSAGNFHGQPLAIPLDQAAIAVCAWGNISERRTATLVNPAMSGLPAFLTPKPGLNSGLMMAQVTAAALASENKGLAHPASADSISTDNDQEDHVSMAPIAARKLHRALDNLEGILAIEIHTAAQAREFHRDLRAGKGAEAVYRLVRGHLPPLGNDRYMAPEIDRLCELVGSGAVAAAAEKAAGSLKA